MPTQVPPLVPQGTGLPEQPVDQSINNLSVRNDISNIQDLKDSLSNNFPVVNVNGQSITDLVNQAENLQSENQRLLDNYPNISDGGTPSNKNYFDVSQAAGNLFNSLNSKQSFASKNTPVSLGEGKDFDRYVNSDDFKAFGYVPSIGREQEYKYGRSMTWMDTLGNAIGGGSQLAWNTFAEGWKGWGRMTNALFSLDASKLMGSEEERYQMAKEQEDIFNKYAIFDTETSADSIWNRQFFGSMLQQAGFAVGAAAQFAVESYLTMGLGSLVEAGALGSAMARTAKATETANELINNVRKASGVILNSEKTANSFATAAKKLIPLYGTIDEMAKLHKAGAGVAQLGMVGLGATRRALSEFNMARSESIYEAASTYQQLKDRLVDEYKEKHGGQDPTGNDLEKIKQSAENASHDNFWTNIGVLSVMNRLQFDNMFKSFGNTRKIFSEEATHLGEDVLKVTGKVEGKPLTKVYEKGWFFGELGAVKDIAKDFGGKTAAWQATKTLGKGLMKIEGSEGLQELIQNASDKGLEDYYYDLYHGKKGYTGKMDAVLSSMQNPLTDMEGMKTFLMGALTGALISPGSKVISKVNESIADRQAKKNNPNYQTKKEQAAENIALVNSMYKDPTQFKKEWIAAVKVNNKAADTMEEAARNHNRYVFYNAKDSAFAKTVAASIKLNMFDSLRDTIKEMGANMSDEEFKKAFDLDPTAKNKGDVKSFMKNVADQVEDYYKTFTTLKDKYGDKVLPELYKNNTPEEYFQAKVAKQALDDAIEILATNTHKAKQAVKRTVELQGEIGKNVNIGASSIEVLTKMGSEQSIVDHIKSLEDDIKKSTVEGVVLTPEQKELLKSKKEELELTKRWQSSHAEVVDNTDESYSPAAEKRAYEAFSDLVNLFNKRANNKAVVSKEDVDSNFINIIDYIRLNKDNKAYVDAVNLLSDPYNMKLITNSMISAHKMVNEIFKKEHKEEVKQATDTEDEIHGDDLEEMAKDLEVKEETNKTELEQFLQNQYNKVVEDAKAQGIKDIPTYEVWKKQAGPALTKQFEESKKTTKKEEPTKKEGETAVDPKAIIINGKPCHILETTVEGDKVYVDYQIDVPEGTSLSEEQLDALKGRFVIDKKTGKATDEAGNPVKLEKPGKEKKEEPTTSTSTETTTEKKYTVRKDDVTRKWYVEDQDGNVVAKDFENVIKANDYIKSLSKPTPESTTSNIEDEKAKVTKDEFKELTRLAKFFLKNPKEPTTVGSIVTRYPALFKAITDIERKRQEEIKTLDERAKAPFRGFPMARDLYDKSLNEINAKYDAELAALESKPEEVESIIEPELNKGDYRRAYALGRAIAQGKNVNSVDNLEILANYPNLIEQSANLEQARANELSNASKEQADGINQKYDQLAKDLIAKGKPVPGDVEEGGDDVPDTSQTLSRDKIAQMDADSKYANKEYQTGYRQIYPSQSLGNTTDLVKVNVTAGTVQYTRDGINKNYVFSVATPEVMPGKSLTYKVITSDEDYANLGVNRLTGKSYNKAELFDKNGNVKEDKFDEVPIGVYSEINGKEVLIGTVHEPLWIQYEINGKTPHIATPEGKSQKEHIAAEVSNNRQFRKVILDAFNKNSNFVITGHIAEKSPGILKMVETPGLLKERINPEIGKGGEENRHGYFAIVRNGRLESGINSEALNVQESEAFNDNIKNLSGVPLLMLPTPVGTFMPTYVGLPKVDKGQAEFIIEAWKAFTGKTENPELVNAVYKAINRKMSGGIPEIGALRDYISQYVTNLENTKKIDRIGNGAEAKPGDARLNIYDDGNLGLEVRDEKTKEWFNNGGKPIRTEADLPENIIDLLQNLKTTIKFEDRRNSDLVGINSSKKVNFITMKDGKMSSKEMTYNEYIMDKATTFVEKGTPSENKSKDWVYFANPVIQMDYSTHIEEDPNFEAEKKETVTPADTFESAPDLDDLFNQMDRAVAANNLTDEQIEEEAKKCNPTNPFEDA